MVAAVETVAVAVAEAVAEAEKTAEDAKLDSVEIEDSKMRTEELN